jgi:hypothetical protein
MSALMNVLLTFICRCSFFLLPSFLEFLRKIGSPEKISVFGDAAIALVFRTFGDDIIEVFIVSHQRDNR